MTENKQTREKLEKRLNEIKVQLNETYEEERIHLDNDMEQQAIQMEQHEVSVTMEENLRKEMIQIEDKLLEMDNS